MFPIFRPVHIVLLVYLSPQLSPAKTLGKNEKRIFLTAKAVASVSHIVKHGIATTGRLF